MNPPDKDPIIALRTICGYENKMQEMNKKVLKIQSQKKTKVPTQAYVPMNIVTKNRTYRRRRALTKTVSHEYTIHL